MPEAVDRSTPSRDRRHDDALAEWLPAIEEDAALVTACAEFGRLGAADRAAWWSVVTDEEADLAQAFTEAWSTRRGELLDLIIDTEAVTLAGVAARARALVQYEPEFAQPGTWASSQTENAARAVIRDLLALTGGAA